MRIAHEWKKFGLSMSDSLKRTWASMKEQVQLIETIFSDIYAIFRA